jgi:hypothetical protein
MGLKQLHDWLEPLRLVATKETEKYVYEEMMEEGIRLFDLATAVPLDVFKEMIGDREGYSPDDRILSFVRRDLRRQSQSQYRGDLDVKSELIIFPLERKTLSLLVTSDVPAIRKCFEKLSGVTDYSYWNNTDWPDNISSRQWETRRKDWEQIISPAVPIKTNGFVVELVSEIPMYFEETPEIDLPSFSSRVLQLAKLLVERDLIAEQVKTGEHISYRSTLNYFASEEGRQVIADRVIKLESVLVKEVNEETLQVKFNECYKGEQTS